MEKDQLHRREEIMERYGSIGASPYKIDIVSFSLETRHGIGMAQASIKPKGHSKKKRTFGEVNVEQKWSVNHFRNTKSAYQNDVFVPPHPALSPVIGEEGSLFEKFERSEAGGERRKRFF